MLRGLLVFLLALTVWVTALWFGLRPDFADWPLTEAATAHLAPPLAVWLVWAGWRLLRQRAAQRQAETAATREAAAEAERQAALAESRVRQAEELRQQQRGYDCRAVAMTQLAQAEDGERAFGLAEGDIAIALTDPDEEVDPETPILEHLRPGLAAALGDLYGRCPAAAVFPIYIQPPAEAVGEEVLACLRAIRAELAPDLALPSRTAGEFNRILFLPAADSVANSLTSLFDSAPDLPGAVVLAFDSARWRCLAEDEEASGDPRRSEERKWLGTPSEGVFALLFTHPDLDAMLDAAERLETDHDAMTPYWERGLSGSGHQLLLAALSPEEREGLRRTPVLARVHRAAFAQFDDQRRHTTAMVRQVQALLERAQVNAALIDGPFAAAAEGETVPAADSPVPDCGWLVHNAGGVDRSGNRLATLGVALFNRGLPVDPIDTATNVVVHGGDYGQARGVALLALTVARAAQEQAAALGAEFSGQDGLGLFFAVPPGEPA